MKRCIKCGCEIENGTNGCMMLPDCFKCHGGYPDYSKSVSTRTEISLDELDAIEARCLGDDWD